MTERQPLELATEREGLVLRQLTPDDAQAYFDAVDASREHLSQFGEPTSRHYPSIIEVRDSIEFPRNPDRLRMGIWSGETFVGSINVTPYGREAAIGYWVDCRHVRNQYATLATRALSAYAAARYQKVTAEVAIGNLASVSVLQRSGYVLTGVRSMRMNYQYGIIAVPPLRKPSA